ncbi:MAG: hypothetical protein AAB492_04440 [Patescibacteria group bacterium]|mgnify:FL=1
MGYRYWGVNITMGLDKGFTKEFTVYMRLIVSGLGLVARVLGMGKKARISPFERERKIYRDDVRRELLKLKEKGLSIPVFTL